MTNSTSFNSRVIAMCNNTSDKNSDYIKKELDAFGPMTTAKLGFAFCKGAYLNGHMLMVALVKSYPEFFTDTFISIVFKLACKKNRGEVIYAILHLSDRIPLDVLTKGLLMNAEKGGNIAIFHSPTSVINRLSVETINTLAQKYYFNSNDNCLASLLSTKMNMIEDRRLMRFRAGCPSDSFPNTFRMLNKDD